MINYINQICPVCGKPLCEGEDIVVCPECGTPHHRACWFEHGDCVNANRHGQKFEWAPVIIEGVNDTKADTAHERKTVICPRCGAENSADVMFCENCGRPLRTASNPVMSERDTDIRARIERELSGEIDGVPVKEIAAYIGPNSPYYVRKFKRMESNPKYRPVSLPTIMFAPLMMFYRKMWKLGIVCALVNIICSVPTAILSRVQAGYLSASSPLVFPGIVTVGSWLMIAEFIINIFFGFIFEPLYKKNVIADIKKLKEENPDQNRYFGELLKNSGPSKAGKIIAMVFMGIYILSLFI